MSHVFTVWGQLYVYAIIWLALGLTIVASVLASSKALVRSRRRYVISGEPSGLGVLISGPIFGVVLIALALSYRLLDVGVDAGGETVPTPVQVVANSVTIQAGIIVTALVWFAALALIVKSIRKRRNDTAADLPGRA
ncbi:hypothetical protein QRB38_19940 [Mycobacterium avium subsp. hominissuis]|uniref:hypothetical protein n=1 Tax=Mycobacterium TaxID=1763 RepID=UPI0002A56509|nr:MULTISPECIES: hypothetical protein [Mycobacterium]AGB27390.1 hypothetical protein Mycsm_07298 [Mycobacterium sp. JS623]MDO2396048.1 hypothetical protein [Mycobacterium avium subsp. hominissuis]